MDLLSAGSFPTYGGEGFSWGGLLNRGLDLLGNYLNAPPEGSQPGDLVGVSPFTSGDPWTDTFFGPGPGAPRYTPKQFYVPDPTGKIHFFGPMGRPLLWSRDMAASRRVARIARKAGRATPRRRRGGR